MGRSERAHSVGPPRRDAFGLIAFLLLAVALPAAVIDPALRSGGGNAILSYLIVLLSALRISLLVASGEPRILWLGVHLFVYPFLGIAALAQTTSDSYPLPSSVVIDQALVTDGLVTVLAGLLAFEVGSIQARKPFAEHRPRAADFSPARIIVLTAVGIGFLAYQFSLTGVAPFFSSREEAGLALAGLDSATPLYALQDKGRVILLRAGTHIPVFVALIGLLCALRSGTTAFTARGRLATQLLLLVLVLANLVANNPLGNSRFWFGVVLLGLLGVFLPWRDPRGMRLLAAGALVVFTVLFGLLDYARRAERDLGDLSPRVNYLENGSYSAFQTILNGEVYLRQHPNTDGQQLLSALLTFVPRSVWPGKSPDTGFVIDPVFNRSATLWTEFDVDFGLTGMVVGLLLVGVLFSRLETRLGRQDLALAIILPILAGFAIFLMRGSLLPVMGNLYPLLLCYVFVLRRRPPDQHSPAGLRDARPTRRWSQDPTMR